jgi:hypothetical protein
MTREECATEVVRRQRKLPNLDFDPNNVEKLPDVMRSMISLAQRLFKHIARYELMVYPKPPWPGKPLDRTN